MKQQIYIVNEYNSSKQMYGGRNRFLVEMYFANPNINFVEIAYMSDDVERKSIPEYTPSNVKYITVGNMKELSNALKDVKVIYSHTFKIKYWKLENKPYIIQQQHNSIKYYGKKFLSSIDELIVYTEGDKNSFKGLVNKITTIPMATNIKISRSNPKYFIYSGGPKKRVINKTYKLIPPSEKLVIDVSSRGLQWAEKKYKDKPNVIIRSSKDKFQIFKDAKLYIHLSNNGYSLSSIEAMSSGVPTLFLDNSPSYKSLSISDKFVVKRRDLKEFIKNYEYHEDYATACHRKVKVFNNENIYSYVKNATLKLSNNT